MDVSYAEKLVYETHADEFARFYSLLMDGNAKAGLTAIEGESDAYVKHFVDSVACEGLFPRGSSVVEIGSGGGFPSIPLRIVREDLGFTLVDSSEKKCAFLRGAVEGLGLSGMSVVCSRAEDLGRDTLFRDRFDACCARAVAPLNVLLELCLPLLRVGGLLVAYKGPSVASELEEAGRALDVLGGRVSSVSEYALPGGYGRRTVVTIEKASPTPAGYPRANGRPAKRPL